MPIIYIYQTGRKIESKEFHNDFFIVKEIDGSNLYWETGEEQRTSNQGGEILIWIQGASFAPQILDILPDWQLIIDGIVMEQGFYTEVDVEGKTIELQYGDYRFVCSFPSIQVEHGSKIAELRALVGKDNV